MKKFGVIALVFISLILVSSFVSAQTASEKFATFAKDFYKNILEPFGSFLFGAGTGAGEIFFAKAMLFLILISLITYAAGQFPPLAGKRAFWISLIISVISVRLITPDWVQAILLPYNALGIALTSFLPFLLYFFFVEKSLVGHTTMRKIAWVFAAVVFMGLFIYQNAAVTETKYAFALFPIGSATVTTTPGFNPTYIYLIAAVASIIMLFADNTIQRAFAKARASGVADTRKATIEVQLDNEYTAVLSTLNTLTFSKTTANTVIDHIRKRAKAIGIVEDLYPKFN